MTETEQLRLTALERSFAEGELNQAELQELEALRDEAGQGWLLDPGPQERAQEPIPDLGAEIARRLARPLTGHDRGEQADLFGQGLLL
jgi:hypothetical protein